MTKHTHNNIMPPVPHRVVAWTPATQDACLGRVESGDYSLLGQLFEVLYRANGHVGHLLRVLASPATWPLEVPADGNAQLMRYVRDVAVDAFRMTDPHVPGEHMLARWAATLLVCGRAVCWRGWRVVDGYLRPYVVLWPTEFTRESYMDRRLEVAVGTIGHEWVPASEPYCGGDWWVCALGKQAWREGLWRSLAWVPYRFSSLAHYLSDAVRTGSGAIRHLHDERVLDQSRWDATAEVGALIESGDTVVTVAGQQLSQLEPTSGGEAVMALALKHLREEVQLTILGRVLSGTEATGLGQGSERTHALKMIEAGELTRVAAVLSAALYGAGSPVQQWADVSGTPLPVCRISTAEAKEVQTAEALLALLQSAVQTVQASGGVLDLTHVLHELELERFLKGAQ